MSISISFIIPAYNVSKHIKQCIESITNQEFNSWELIIVDDGSTDDTVVICKEFAQKDERIKVVCQENSGSAVARNTGIKLAKGKWIAFIDGDDWIEDNFYGSLKEYIESEYDFIMYSHYEVYEKRKTDKCVIKKEMILDKKYLRLMVKDSIDTEKRAAKVANSRSQLWTKIYRRKFLYENDLYMASVLRMCQDVMFNLKVYSCAREAVVIPCTLYNYRLLENSTCHQFNTVQEKRVKDLMNTMGDYVLNIDWLDEKEILYKKRILVSLVNICKLTVCHKNNPNNYFIRRKLFLQLCKQEPFIDALETRIINEFSLKKCLCMWIVKFRIFFILDIVLKKYSL